MSNKEQRFRRAIKELSKYYGLYTVEDLTGRIALGRVQGRSNPADGSTNNPTTVEPSPLDQRILSLFLDTTEGAPTIIDIVNEMKAILEDEAATEEFRRRVFSTFEIYYNNEVTRDILPSTGEISQQNPPADILQMLRYSNQDNPADNQIITNNGNPTKSNPGLSVILSNSHRISISNRNINPVVIFLNGIPNLEMARAVPYVDVKVLTARAPTNSSGNIQALSLGKFLLGAQKVDGEPLNSVINANRVTGVEASQNPVTEVYTAAGMEIFTSPQTLINADATNNRSLRSNPILDKFKSFMTLKSLDINVVPSTGIMSYKTAQMSLTLHDRSRMAEIAEFIRADLYGTNEIIIEYGYYHPDGETTTTQTVRNPYGDLLNGMRVIEKYQVVNSSFSFDEAGQVNINLSLAMRGGNEFFSENIASTAGNNVDNILRDINTLQQTVAQLRSRVFGDVPVSEIRGVQILDAAQDALNHLTLDSETSSAMRDFIREFQGNNAEVDQLIDTLNNLFGEMNNRRRRNRRRGGAQTDGGAIGELRRSIRESIRSKIERLAPQASENLNLDPFYVNVESRTSQTLSQINRIRNRSLFQGRLVDVNQRRRVTRNFASRQVSAGVVSLAKLLLFFVGEPLARTQKFDDVQMVFYPFNRYAGYANRLNIGNFAIDLQYFTETFERFRLERISRSTNINLSEFMAFLQATLIDDPAALSYGLIDERGALFRAPITEENGQQAIGLEAVDNPAEHNTRITQLLRDVTPNGEFRLPQVDFHIETLPQRRGTEDGEDVNQLNPKSILRIHIFDRQASAYDGLTGLLASARDSEFEAIGTVGSQESSSSDNSAGDGERTENEGVNRSFEEIQSFLDRAEQSSLIEVVDGTGDAAGETGTSAQDRGAKTYRIRGGPQEIKNFLMSSMPYVIYGAAGTNILNANLSSMQNSELSTINLMRSFRRSELEPNGENPGGLPMRIIPTELNLTTRGCPLISFAQMFFVDFQTGTTADNIYGVTSINHRIVPGEFTTDIKFAPQDGYTRYYNIINRIRESQAQLQSIQTERDRESDT